MKILFLDFDGVLNPLDNMYSNYYLWKKNPDHKSKDGYGDLFDQRCVNWLEYIILKTNCKLVISSTWRMSGLNVMRRMWEDRNIKGEIYSITSQLPGAIRGSEIAKWLKENKYVQSYYIVDDNNDMWEDQLLVQTDPVYGLDRSSAIKIINILNNENP